MKKASFPNLSQQGSIVSRHIINMATLSKPILRGNDKVISNLIISPYWYLVHAPTFFAFQEIRNPLSSAWLKRKTTYKIYLPAVASAARLNAARLPTIAVNPLLIAATEHLLPHVWHCRKNNRVSFVNSVSDERHV